MSGHSKWSTIKRKKGKEDAKRGQIFTKLMREVTSAARIGGGDPAGNPRLRHAIEAARAQNMPLANIERAIKKGTGELEGEAYEEVTYEGYGPAGVAILVQSLTNNKNRTVAEIRHLFNKHNGSLGETGCVGWIFEKKGIFEIDRNKVTEEKMMEIALEFGAEDIVVEDDTYQIKTDFQSFDRAKLHLSDCGLQCLLAEIAMVPKMTVKVQGKEAEQTIRLIENLEELEDVQHVYANFDIEDKEMLQLAISV
ncbi:MAG: YebC/PmpR family DNA-binding transcriptional regulator [Deltaproteobacteria bacterium]|nr:YebC/PmpR family DNA-binding transcriptional regulator [Deltaproteobacteria bacterium]